MESVVIHLTGSAEEVRGALLILAGGQIVRQLPTSVDVSLPIESKESKAVQSRVAPYSTVLCARDGCHNKLTVKQVKQGSKYCGLRCAGLARRGMVRGVPTPAGVTIVAGEGVTRGSVMSEESAAMDSVPS